MKVISEYKAPELGSASSSDIPSNTVNSFDIKEATTIPEVALKSNFFKPSS